MTCCLGQCPWNPSPPACSDGRARNVEREFALGDPPCWRGLTSPSASQNHSGFHSPLGERTERSTLNWFPNWEITKDSVAFPPADWANVGYDVNTHPALNPRGRAVLSPTYFPLWHFQRFRPQRRGDESATEKKTNTVKLIWNHIQVFGVRQTEPVWATCGIMLGWCPARTHVHGGVDLCDSFILCGELINLHAVTDQLAHDLDLQLVQFAPVHGIRLGNDGDDVHLHRKV